MGSGVLLPFVAVAVGGAIGAVLRFSVYKMVDTQFPWATFIVNIIGCCLASYLMFRYGFADHDVLKPFIFVGIFGAFTTMSTFSIDTVNLITEGAYMLAAGNVVLNSVICVLGALAGHYLATL